MQIGSRIRYDGGEPSIPEGLIGKVGRIKGFNSNVVHIDYGKLGLWATTPETLTVLLNRGDSAKVVGPVPHVSPKHVKNCNAMIMDVLEEQSNYGKGATIHALVKCVNGESTLFSMAESSLEKTECQHSGTKWWQ